MSKQQKPTREYSRLEIFEGYYWLVCHIDPGHLCFRAYIYSSGYLHPKPPECLYTAMKEVGCGFALEVFSIIYPHTDINFIWYHLNEGCSVFNNLFKWHIDKGISKWVLHTRDSKPITCMTDIERLWKEIGIGFNKGMPNIKPEESENRHIKTTADHVALRKTITLDPKIYYPLTDQMKGWLKEREEYFFLSAHTLDSIKAYLAEEYNTYREELSHEVKERYFIKDILGSTNIKKTSFYELRKKKLIPQHYAKWGNSPYWLKDGFDKACESIEKNLTKSHTKK